MSENLSNAIILSSVLFGSIYLFNSSLQRLIELEKTKSHEPNFSTYIDVFIIGSTGFLILAGSQTAVNILNKTASLLVKQL